MSHMCAEIIKKGCAYLKENWETMLMHLLVLVWLGAVATVAGHMFHVSRGGNSAERLLVSHRDAMHRPASSNHPVEGKSAADDMSGEIPPEVEKQRPLISDWQAPDSCRRQYYCKDPPIGFDFYNFGEKLYEAKVLSDAQGPPAINEGINTGKLSTEEATNDILVRAEYLTITLLKDANDITKIKYLIPQHPKHNQTIRQVFCDVTPRSECNKKAYSPRDQLEKFSVQMYSRIILDAVDVYSRRVVKVLFTFENGCVCRYRTKK